MNDRMNECTRTGGRRFQSTWPGGSSPQTASSRPRTPSESAAGGFPRAPPPRSCLRARSPSEGFCNGDKGYGQNRENTRTHTLTHTHTHTHNATTDSKSRTLSTHQGSTQQLMAPASLTKGMYDSFTQVVARLPGNAAVLCGPPISTELQEQLSRHQHTR